MEEQGRYAPKDNKLTLEGEFALLVKNCENIILSEASEFAGLFNTKYKGSENNNDNLVNNTNTQTRQKLIQEITRILLGKIHENGFEINLPNMKVGKKFQFEFEQSRIDAFKNEKGELELDVLEKGDLN